MKKILTILLALSILCGGASAQQVKVADMEALSGETVSLAIQIDTEGGSYTGMEFDILFPVAGFSTTGHAVNTTSGWDGAFTIGDVGGVGIENLARCALLSYTDTPLSGEGIQSVGTVEFTVDANMSQGEYIVKLTNITLIGDGRSPVQETTFQLNVVNVHTVVLDENSTEAPEASGGAVNVKIRRTITAGNWSTICLPFAMTNDQVQAAFGDDVELADFTGYEAEEDGGGDIVGITVNFVDVVTPAIEANHPYIIKVSSPVSEFTVEDVEVEPMESPQVSFGYTTGKGKNTVYHPSDFTGTYVADFDFYNNATSYPLFLNGNNFYYATENTRHMKAFRGYFDFDDYLAEAEGAAVKMAINLDGLQTAVNEIVNDISSDEKWYDLSGRRISNRTGASLLPKGIYIVNGKKTIIR